MIEKFDFVNTPAHRSTPLRTAKASWLNLSILQKLAFAVVVIGFVATASFALGYGVIKGVAVGFIITIFIGAVLSVPEALKTAGATIVWLPVFVPFSAFLASYGATSNGIAPGSLDIASAVLNLIFFYMLAVAISVWKSYGKVWVTVLLLGVSTLTLGTLMVYIYPPLGLNAARIAMLLLLLYRCGGFRLVKDKIIIFYKRKIRKEKLDNNIYTEQMAVNILSTWKKRTKMENNIANQLSKLGNNYYVFERVISKKGTRYSDFFVIGPTGGFFIKPKDVSSGIGKIKETSQRGVLLGKEQLGPIAGNLYEQSVFFSKKLKVHKKDFELIVVVPDSTVGENFSDSFILYAGENPLPVAQTVITTGDSLLDNIIQGKQIWSKGQRQRVLYKLNKYFNYTPVAQEIDIEQMPVEESDTVDINTFTGILEEFTVNRIEKNNSNMARMAKLFYLGDTTKRTQEYSCSIEVLIKKEKP